MAKTETDMAWIVDGARVFCRGQNATVTGVERWGHYEPHPQGTPRFVSLRYDARDSGAGVQDTVPAAIIRKGA